MKLDKTKIARVARQRTSNHTRRFVLRLLPAAVVFILVGVARDQRIWAAGENIAGANKDVPRLRPGLLEALKRRATFTRAHRGPVSAPVDGNAANSSDFAAGWHAEDRIYFAWHQENDRVVLAAFKPSGEIALAPQAIGRGRWPRLAVDGNRVAVAWSNSEGGNVVVRLNDGRH